jgi:hypothetical protein
VRALQRNPTQSDPLRRRTPAISSANQCGIGAECGPRGRHFFPNSLARFCSSPLRLSSFMDSCGGEPRGGRRRSRPTSCSKMLSTVELGRNPGPRALPGRCKRPGDRPARRSATVVVGRIANPSHPWGCVGDPGRRALAAAPVGRAPISPRPRPARWSANLTLSAKVSGLGQGRFCSRFESRATCSSTRLIARVTAFL